MAHINKLHYKENLKSIKSDVVAKREFLKTIRNTGQLLAVK
ncbi:MAG: hypothetical protein CM1200mP31_2640 [Candidatus Neomarinimicrobiota bacterium]|nr:MAG: hypothetical protein CM1200mP31_2640 [Candidatus Neomarinimicrobiota bacterium]